MRCINKLISSLLLLSLALITNANAAEKPFLVDSYKNQNSTSRLFSNGFVKGSLVPITEERARVLQNDLDIFCNLARFDNATGKIYTENGYVILRIFNRNGDYGFFWMHLMEGAADEIIFSEMGLVRNDLKLLGIECT